MVNRSSFDKAIDTLFKTLTKDELLSLHESWDGDAYDSFFHEFTERLNYIAPEAFENK